MGPVDQGFSVSCLSGFITRLTLLLGIEAASFGPFFCSRDQISLSISPSLSLSLVARIGLNEWGNIVLPCFISHSREKLGVNETQLTPFLPGTAATLAQPTGGGVLLFAGDPVQK